MVAPRNMAGRFIGNRKIAATGLAVATAALVLTTQAPQQLLAGVGGSAALAELAARSPGVRVGGVALKSKKARFAKAAPVAGAGPAGAPGPGNALASVLGTSAGPEGPIPTSGAAAPAGFPGDFAVPAIPGAPVAGTPSTGPGGDFGNVGFPPVGGLPIFVPGGSGGGGGGGGGTPGGTTPIGGTPGGGTIPPPTPLPTPTVPGGGAIPEPSTWLLLIAGFGMIGSAMRRSRRVRFA